MVGRSRRPARSGGRIVVAVAAAALILSAAAQPAPAETFAPTPDFTPAHPYVFMTPADVQTLRDNVNVKKLPWAVALYNQAKADADANPPVLKTTETLFATTTYGKHMLAATLVYLASDDPHYGDLAVDWLMTYANAGVTYTSYDDLAKLSGIHMVFAWTYDLMYGYMQANRPADLAKVTSWLNYYMRSLYGSFTINTGFNGNCSKAVMAYVLGKGAVIDDIAAKFRSFYESMPGGYYGDFGSGQAFKNYDITLECLMTYAIATHHAAERGYSSFDALTWRTSQGFNLVQDHWRTMVKYATPSFQVPFQTMWRGPLFWIPNGTAVPQELYAVTHDPEWGTIVAANPGRALDAQAIDGNWETIDPWPGLTHGREVDNATGIRNDSFDNTGRGFAVMLSGDSRGVETPDQLHAYLMHGSYGAVEPLNLKLYGKGEKLTQEHDTAPNDQFGERGSGGIYVKPIAKQNLPADATVADSSDILLWDANPDVKIIAADYHGLGGTVLPNYHRRTVAVTSDYFFDLYDVNDTGTTPFTYVVDGVGPDSSSVRVNGQDQLNPQHVATSGDLTATWPNHMKLTMLNNAPSDVTMFKSVDLPPALPYASDPMHVLQVRRSAAGQARFESVIEPLGLGGSPGITSVERLTGGPGDVVAVKVSASRYTDYLAYSETLGASTVGGAAETFGVDGRYGYIRFDKRSGSLRAWGSVSSFTLPAAGAARVCVNGRPESFSREGDSVSWPGTGAGSLDPTPCQFPIDSVAPSAPADVAVSGSTETSISASWTPATDNVEITAYGLYLDGRKVGESPTASTTFDRLSCGTTHTLGVDAVDAAANRSPIVTVTASTLGCDVTPPTVSLLQPPDGSSLGGATLVTAAASDDRGVAGVQFQLDGAPLDVEDTQAPYELLWDSTHTPDGVHTLTAVAHDAAGNATTSAPVAVTVMNGPPIAFVQDLGTATASDTAGTISLTIGPRGVGAGDTAVLWAGMSSRGIAIARVADSRGNDYTVDATVNHPVQSLNTFVASGYMATALRPGDRITVTFSRALYSARLLAGAEFSGIAPVTRVDREASATGYGTVPASPATADTAQPDELVVDGFGTDSTALFTSAAGFTALGSATASPSGVTRTIHQAFRIVGGVGSYRATATLSGKSSWTAAVVTYRAG